MCTGTRGGRSSPRPAFSPAREPLDRFAARSSPRSALTHDLSTFSLPRPLATRLPLEREEDDPLLGPRPALVLSHDLRLHEHNRFFRLREGRKRMTLFLLLHPRCRRVDGHARLFIPSSVSCRQCCRPADGEWRAKDDVFRARGRASDAPPIHVFLY